MGDDSSLNDGHHLARGAAANALILLAANFRGIFTFLIARLLGAAAFGRFGVVFMTTDLVSKAGSLGFDSSIVPMVATRNAAGNGEGCRQVFRRAISLAVVASTTIALGGIALVLWAGTSAALAPFHSFFNNFQGGEWLMLLALPGIAVSRISTGAARGLMSMRNEFYSRGITETWVTIGVFAIAMAIGARDTAPALAVVAGTSAAAMVAFVLARQALAARPSASSSLDTDETSTTAMLRFSLPTAGSSLLNVLVTEADVLLLAAYVGRAPGVTPETLGVFAVAAQVAVGLRKVRQIFDPIFAPVVATRAASVQRDRLRDTVAAPGRWVLAAQLPLVGVLVLSGGSVMSIYGSQYRQGALWLALLGLAHGANTFAGLVETLLMIERPHLNLLNAATTVAVQLVSGVLLIPRYGVTGAAVAMCLGFAVQGALRFAEVRHVFGWSWPWGALRRPLVAFACAFAPSALLRLQEWGGEVTAGALFLCLYAAAWWIMGAEPSDREVWTTLRSAGKAK